MSDFLAEMAASSRARADAAMAMVPTAALRKRALDRPPGPALTLSGSFDLIAEVKLRAPSAGRLAVAPDDREGFVVERARRYGEAGAAAISVLAEPSRFDGRLSDVGAASVVDVPVMRKDFVVDAHQVWEARDVGAGGVLLIARMLPGGQLAALCDVAQEAGLFVLLEAFDEVDLERCGILAKLWPEAAAPVLVGVNTRDLSTLQVDPDRLERVAPALPSGVVCVAESGLRQPDDAARVRGWGYSAALVGSALMQADDPGALVAGMIEAGRAACS